LGFGYQRKKNFSKDHVLALTAFGAGILIVIEAEESIGIAATLIAFLGGAIIFTIADMIAKKKEVAQASDSIQSLNHWLLVLPSLLVHISLCLY
jgi:hypothetical protein